jgi:O-methyltransferase domain
MLERKVIPEILDHLAADDPEALRSRRDLRRINFLMGNERWVLRAVAGFQQAVMRGIVELGAGDGQLSGKLARRYPESQVTAYDLAPRPAALERRVYWERGDVFEKISPAGGIAVVNLFLHHFERAELAQLGEWLSGFEVLIFNEPDRAWLPHGLGLLMHPWINSVTRHDMHVSITAGFRVGEMVDFLGLDEAAWSFEETWTWRGARRVIGWRD